VLYDQQRVTVVLQNGRKLEDDSYMATVEGLRGVIAVGDTIEECRDDLIGVIEGWVALGLRLGHTIPTIDGHTINVSLEPVPVVE
jgi:predicted RNase H-like HicB family nuclease